jgi:hypothetical protein
MKDGEEKNEDVDGNARSRLLGQASACSSFFTTRTELPTKVTCSPALVEAHDLQTHLDTIELADGVGEAKTRGISDLSEKSLGSSEATDVHRVLGDEPRDGARAILNSKIRVVSHVGGGLRVVVTRVETAGRAVSGRKPQVGRTSVVDNLEGLGRGTDGDGAVVLGILESLDGDVGDGTQTVLAGDLAENTTLVEDALLNTLKGQGGLLNGLLDNRRRGAGRKGCNKGRLHLLSLVASANGNSGGTMTERAAI